MREKEEEIETEKDLLSFYGVFRFLCSSSNEDVCARLFVGNSSCDPVSVYCMLRGLVDVERTHFYLLMHLNYLCRFLNFA